MRFSEVRLRKLERSQVDIRIRQVIFNNICFWINVQTAMGINRQQPRSLSILKTSLQQRVETPRSPISQRIHIRTVVQRAPTQPTPRTNNPRAIPALFKSTLCYSVYGNGDTYTSTHTNPTAAMMIELAMLATSSFAESREWLGDWCGVGSY
jgi:hypothetical protein